MDLRSMYPYTVDSKEANASLPRSVQHMTMEQQKFYNENETSSGGFDVDNCYGFMPGKIVPIPEGSGEWNQAHIAAQWASLYYHSQVQAPHESVRLVKANYQAVAGLMYYLTFSAVDETGVEATYQCKLWLQPGAKEFQGLFFNKL